MNECFFTAKLTGGLGNQMFQIAHAISQGKRFGIPTIFQPISETNNQGNPPSSYINNIYKNIVFKNFDKVDKVIISKWSFSPINPDPKYSTEFRGYFQSSKNFYGYDEYIKNIFYPHIDFLKKINEKEINFLNPKNIIVHIRRGDYLNFLNIHPTIDISYIKKCINMIGGCENLYIVSDDKNWVKKNIDIENIVIINDLKDYEELWLMSLFKNVIMSNSTFSWWGAFLNKNENLNVFVPGLWFGPDGEKDINNLYEKNWNKINVKFKEGKLICY